MNIVIGYGEIGKAVANVVGEHVVVDPGLGMDASSHNVEVLHICFPPSEDFVEIVNGYIEKFAPAHVIVWSSTRIGMCSSIGDFVVHTPVEGKHPELAKSIKLMTRWIGCLDKMEREWAGDYFTKIGLQVKEVEASEYTEALKLLSTTEYGINLAFASYKQWVANVLEMDYELMKDWNQSYNDLYKKLGMTQYQKFILDAPENGLGGHCVIENSVLLDDQFSHPIINRVLALGKDARGIREDKPYLNRAWLYAEYWGKERSSEDIGKQFGCTGANILRVMKRMRINRRTKVWTDNEIETLKELCGSHTYKEIAVLIGKTHDAVRIRGLQLGLESSYDPSKPDDETRKKISATLQGITVGEWNGFKESANKIIRKSEAYQEWRKTVFERDDYTCQFCGAKSAKGKPIVIHADHIKRFSDYPELRLDIDNGRTLCIDCHRKTDTWGAKKK